MLWARSKLKTWRKHNKVSSISLEDLKAKAKLLSVAVVHIERPRALLAAVVLFAFGAAPTAAIVLIQGNPFLAPVGVTSAPLQAVLNGLTAR